uniref:phosphonoacetate hydrolase n=1 Tax=Pararhizobium sp. IMCC3301 TaxID=3067904 RepID=UPI002741B40A|nr:phosphonoacetate hydrolase [Pararhizobium sp. IMCC3301]
MNDLSPVSITANGRDYARPKVPAIAICLDGCEPAYLDAAIAAGLMPTLKRIKQSGTVRMAHSVIPSFTNPNNLSIATGRPPSVHGICGNFLYDPETGEEVMMNDVRFLRAPTVFQACFDAGLRVAIVTAKDKLRAMLGNGLSFGDGAITGNGRAICFSAEKSDTTTIAEHGIDNASAYFDLPVPEVYSAELSEFVFAAGVRLLKDFKPDLMYLTTTDYVQHKYAPGVPEANVFYEMFDRYLTELDAAGAAIVVTADHGMKPKHLANGEPAVIYLQDLLDDWLGEAAARVILPITDPYVVHHGALGSFATAYLPADTNVEEIISRLSQVDQILLVVDKKTACERFELPEDRIGDIVVISGENMTLGTSAHRHDLAALDEPLRSHGGLTEQEVPFIVNRVLPDLPDAPVLRNFDAFHFACMAAAL